MYIELKVTNPSSPKFHTMYVTQHAIYSSRVLHVGVTSGEAMPINDSHT